MHLTVGPVWSFYYKGLYLAICYRKLKHVFIPTEFSKFFIQFCFSRLYLGIETVSCHVQLLAIDGKDRHGLKLEKIGSHFSSFNAKVSAARAP